MYRSLKQTAALVAVPALTLAIFSETAQADKFRLEEATVADINQSFDAGVLTAEKLVQLYLNRIEAYDDTINSLIAVNPNALEIARTLDLERKTTGPRSLLHGIPVILKDNFDTFDLPTTGGSILLKDSIPPDDAFTVKQLRDAGAIVLAKANLSEFALSAGRAGYSSLGGLTVNPYNLLRNPSGSSGGTGAAIAANFGVIGTGSDTGGSIRGPSAVQSLVGIKPTLGLLSRDGIIPLALSFDTGGPMTRTVEDAAIALGVMTGIDPADPVTFASAGKFYKDYTQFLDPSALQGSRIGVVRNFFGGNEEVDGAIETALDTLENLGATVVDSLTFSDEFLEERSRISGFIFDSEFQSQIETYLATLSDGYPKTLEEMIALSESPEIANSPNALSPARIETFKRNLASGGLTNPDYIDAVENGIPFVRNTILELMDINGLDALVYPTSRCPAAPLYTVTDPTYVCNPGPSPTNLANIAGFPDIQVPAGFTADGLPISLSFFGRTFSEPTLIGYAYAYEQATKFRSPPPLFPALPGETIAVPEPSTAVGLGIIGLAALGLKRKQQRNAISRFARQG